MVFHYSWSQPQLAPRDFERHVLVDRAHNAICKSQDDAWHFWYVLKTPLCDFRGALGQAILSGHLSKVDDAF